MTALFIYAVEQEGGSGPKGFISFGCHCLQKWSFASLTANACFDEIVLPSRELAGACMFKLLGTRTAGSNPTESERSNTNWQWYAGFLSPWTDWIFSDRTEFEEVRSE